VADAFRILVTQILRRGRLFAVPDADFAGKAQRNVSMERERAWASA
jgi:hypothetical protein